MRRPFPRETSIAGGVISRLQKILPNKSGSYRRGHGRSEQNGNSRLKILDDKSTKLPAHEKGEADDSDLQPGCDSQVNAFSFVHPWACDVEFDGPLIAVDGIVQAIIPVHGRR